MGSEMCIRDRIVNVSLVCEEILRTCLDAGSVFLGYAVIFELPSLEQVNETAPSARNTESPETVMPLVVAETNA